ncbi:hypothetical protein SDC9_191809 [bioreactor metagenome]|uniref:Uncharacterized protein n=1 Tax=bioreactor metagenome TaxID=1076179 RepID=A0A645HYZ4_9ZZZZ
MVGLDHQLSLGVADGLVRDDEAGTEGAHDHDRNAVVHAARSEGVAVLVKGAHRHRAVCRKAHFFRDVRGHAGHDLARFLHDRGALLHGKADDIMQLFGPAQRVDLGHAVAAGRGGVGIVPVRAEEP